MSLSKLCVWPVGEPYSPPLTLTLILILFSTIIFTRNVTLDPKIILSYHPTNNLGTLLTPRKLGTTLESQTTADTCIVSAS